MYEDSSKERFTKKLLKLKNSLIKVQLVDGNVVTGKLIEIDPDYLNLIIEEPLDSGTNTQEFTLIPGSSVSYIKWIKSKKNKRDLEGSILKLLKDEPNITKEEIAKILNIDIKNVDKIIRGLRKRGLLDQIQQDNVSNKKN
ncbi:MAG: MarR family transcriptional regulator [Candidatus Methanomethylicia archaeon]|nr:MarR family transcriptional regulator [Candidatus Methanomethylicia archaeon]MCX8168973.1 MarR family transcriptional regulator [Candidatus Methanomethylicia archaeon]MDW7988705.1 MarR family transcriptional regulator [Nitrososphaerota archaeon]